MMQHVRGRISTKLMAAVFLLAGALASGGCVVGDEEFEAAQRERDQNLNDSQVMLADNDRLNKEIARIYNDCDVLASQLAMVSAASLHNRLTAAIGRPKPEPPAPAARPAAPARTTTRQSADSGNGNSRRQAESGGSSAGGSQSSGGSPSQAPGGASTPSGGGTTPPPSGGSLDWGSLTSF